MREYNYIPGELKQAVELAWEKKEMDIYELLKKSCRFSFDDTYRCPDEKQVKELIQGKARYIFQYIDEFNEADICGIEISKLRDIEYIMQLNDCKIREIHSKLANR